MEKLVYKTVINNTPEKLWDILWSDKGYREWTTVFAEGSHYETDWKEGSRILFMDGNGCGMVSKVAANKPYEFMSFEHLGEIRDGVEDTTSEKVKEWAGAHENYTLKKVDGKTELTVEMDINEEFKKYFENTWPKAMDKLKEMAESN